MAKSKRKPRALTAEGLEIQYESHCQQMGLELEVFSDGPLNATVAFVGEGPGEMEVRGRKPFIGGTGMMLWEATKKYGFTRDTVYVTNVVKRQISLSRKGNERHAVQREELEKWINLLQWELSQLPNVTTIFVLGNFALEAVLGLNKITSWRGSVLDCDLPNGRHGQVVCTFNPAYCMVGREPRFEPFFNMDCKKLDLVHRQVWQPHPVEAIINPTFREAIAFIRDLQKARRPVSFDIEGINNEIACFGLSNNPHRAMCINLRDDKRNRYTVSQEADLHIALQQLCESNKIVAQNAQFDAYFTRMHNLIRIRPWYDTLLAHHTLYPLLPHNLGFLVAQYTNHPFYKDESELYKEGGDIDTFWEYNCKDAALTYATYEKTYAELKQSKLDKFFFDHVMHFQPHGVEATVHGVAVDLDMKEVILEQVQADVNKIRDKFWKLCQELTGEEEYWPNPNSWPQLQNLFFDKLKLEGRGRSTNEENRKAIMNNTRTSPLAKEMLVTLDRFKEEDKFRGTYAQAKVSPDGRFRCEYKQFGVAKAPGRLSSSKLLVEREGGNMQNQPVRARGMYVADPGCVFIYFDLAQAEAQVVSFRADIPKWKEQYARAKATGYDSHRALASEMFSMAYESVPTKDFSIDPDTGNPSPTKRYIAKRCRHGLNYRMQKDRLAQVTELPYHEAAMAFVLYHKITPELQRWWAAEERDFRKNREMYNALGRRFRAIQRLDESVLESIIAFYPQSTIGDKITQVWYQSEEDDDWPDQMYARVGIDVHDNLVAISVPKYAKTVMKILKKYAESPIWIQDVYKRRPAEPLSIPCELKQSYPTSWSPKAKRVNGKWQGDFIEDKNGLHRWSHMKVVEL